MATRIIRRVPKTVLIRRYEPALQTPVLLAVSPSTGPIAGGTAVTLTGYGFTGATSSSLLQPGFTVVSDTTITGVTVAHAVGVVSATVSNAIYTSAPLANAFTYLALAAPAVIAINKSLGDSQGGTTVIIQVNDTTACTGATVCGVALTSFAIVDATHVQGITQVMTASATPGAVTVSNPIGTGTLNSAFEAFAPENIANCFVDLDADTVVQSSSRVSQITDKSGTGNHAVQATGGNQPLLVTNLLNGRPGVKDDDGARLMTTTQSGPTNAAHVFLIVQTIGWVATGFCWNMSDNGDSIINWTVGSTSIFDAAYDTVRNAVAIGSPPGSNAYVYELYSDNTKYYNKLAGVSQNTQGTNTFAKCSSTTPSLFVTKPSNVHAAGNVLYKKFGYTRELTAPEHARVAAYLLDRYGLAA